MSDTGTAFAVPKIAANTWIQSCLSTLTMLAFAALALTPYRFIGFGLVLASLLALGVLFWVRRPGGYITVQLLALAAILVYYDRRHGASHAADLVLIVTGVAQMALLLNQNMFRRVVLRDSVLVANLPGADFPREPMFDPNHLCMADLVLVALIGVTAAVHAPTWPIAAATGLVAAAHLLLLGQAAARRRGEHLAAAAIHKALAAYRPAFALYFTAPPASQFHVEMWLPYLEKVGQRFVLVLREKHSFDAFARATTAPVVYCKNISSLDNVVVPSLRAVFYVNNGVRNAQMVRFHQLTHVQLLHGDSDKPPSYNPVTAMFDRIYVAGQAAIDRYAAHSVHIEPAKFVIVGRPQVSAIAIETAPISTVVDETVLYAPTWTGYFDDTSHTSLGIGDKIIRALLERGVRVIYRTHPYTNRFPQTRAWHLALLDLLTEEEQRTGRGHLFGAAADTDLTLIECFNLCDAAVADVSGVSSDFLYSEKPLAMTDALGEGDDFVTNNPLAAATYVVSPDGGNLPAVLDALLGDDPLREERKRMKRYVLGDFAADAYEHAFLVAARREVIGAVAPAIPAQPSTTSRGLTTQR